MNPLTLLFRLPLMPLRGFVQLAEILHDQAERELHDPASLRRELEEAEEARASGEMSNQDVAHVEDQAMDRLVSSPGNASAGESARHRS